MFKIFKKHRIFIIFILFGVILYACQSAPFVASHTDPKTAGSKIDNNPLINCKEPRLPVCTREYRPVCALKDTGIRCVTTPCPSSKKVTYSNACTACADKKVIGYQMGACL